MSTRKAKTTKMHLNMLDLKKLKNDLIELIRRSGDDLMSKG